MKVPMPKFKLDLAHYMCSHLASRNYTRTHKVWAGICIIIVGVLITKIATSYFMVHVMLDAIGYAFHGIGLAPILEVLFATVD